MAHWTIPTTRWPSCHWRSCHWPAWAGWLTTAGVLLTALVIACGPGSTLAPADDESDPPKLLLLRSGAVVEGTILLSGDDYLVKLPKGNMLVPRQLVRLACRDLQEAYRALHDRAALQGEGESYLSLARWCLTQKLFDEATFELQTALDLEPGLDEARQLLTRTVELQKEHARNALNAGVVIPEPQREKSETEAEALGGLSPELAATFARRIQPLLVNNCASTGCHGPRSENNFRLQRVTSQGGPNRLAADRNLASVLDQLNPQKPADSPLLLTPRGNHGRRGKPVFGGVTGKDQYAELKTWVLAVAREEVVQTRAQRRSTPQPPSQTAPVQLLGGTGPETSDSSPPPVTPAPEEQTDGDSFSDPPARLPPEGESLRAGATRESTATRASRPDKRTGTASPPDPAPQATGSPGSHRPTGRATPEVTAAGAEEPPAVGPRSPAAAGEKRPTTRGTPKAVSGRGATSQRPASGTPRGAPPPTSDSPGAGRAPRRLGPDLGDDPFDPQEFNQRRQAPVSKP